MLISSDVSAVAELKANVLAVFDDPFNGQFSLCVVVGRLLAEPLIAEAVKTLRRNHLNASDLAGVLSCRDESLAGGDVTHLVKGLRFTVQILHLVTITVLGVNPVQ